MARSPPGKADWTQSRSGAPKPCGSNMTPRPIGSVHHRIPGNATPTAATSWVIPRGTTVSLPWAAIPMGDSPASHRSQAGDTPGRPVGGNAMEGVGKVMDGRFARGLGSRHCLKIGQNTDCQSADARFGEATPGICDRRVLTVKAGADREPSLLAFRPLRPLPLSPALGPAHPGRHPGLGSTSSAWAGRRNLRLTPRARAVRPWAGRLRPRP